MPPPVTVLSVSMSSAVLLPAPTALVGALLSVLLDTLLGGGAVRGRRRRRRTHSCIGCNVLSARAVAATNCSCTAASPASCATPTVIPAAIAAAAALEDDEDDEDNKKALCQSLTPTM